MARNQSNNAYMVLNSVNLAPYFVDIEMEKVKADHSTNAGAGLEWEESGPGLSRITFSGTIEIDDAAIATIYSAMNPGVYSFVYGPDGNTQGNRCFSGNVFLTTSTQQGQSVDKTPMSFSFSAMSTGAPTKDPFNGGVFD